MTMPTDSEVEGKPSTVFFVILSILYGRNFGMFFIACKPFTSNSFSVDESAKGR